MGWVLLAHVLGLLHYLSKRCALRQHLVLRARQKIVMQTIREETARHPYTSYPHTLLPPTHTAYELAGRCSKVLGPNLPP